MDACVQAKLNCLPVSPGIYIFKDRAGKFLYVGKASNLRARVRSYFQQGSADERFFIGRLEQELGDLETYVTTSEKEAALLENSFIKQHQPRYNIKLRDDKDFISLRLDPRDDWPRLEVVRRPKKDGARYFGPYHSASSARSILRVVNRYFQLRTCTNRELQSRTRPCLQYQIKRCQAPCVFRIDRNEYARQVINVGLFLEGRHDELVQHLTRQMRKASKAMEYETAARCRDQIQAVKSSLEKQCVSLVSNIDQDVFGYFRQEDRIVFAVLMARRGRVMGVRTYALRDAYLPNDELLSSFVSEYYQLGSFVPDELILPESIEAEQGLAELLSTERASPVKLTRPQRGSKARLLRMAMENAAHAYQEKARAVAEVETLLIQIMQRFDLPSTPRRIECVDVSHSSGVDTVAAVVALRDGQPDAKSYRGFTIRRVSDGDDYGAMYEALSRRFKRASLSEPGWELPDLLIVDGGKGQMGVALTVLGELEIEDVPVIALAKEKANARGQKLVDRVYLPGRKNPIDLRESDPAARILMLARDEAHRVSNRLRLKRDKRTTLRSDLDEIKGVGPKTRSKLLSRLGSLDAIRTAGVQQLLEAGATRRQARLILASLRGEDGAKATDETNSAERAAVDNAFPLEE
ncbi:MAG: excinuclease ABC subunit UvrC [Deltaproteobacteria bacterium]|nr:excinuclease ABC subunit UvrC [Deltaproteobacteria bacterium]